MALQLPLDIVSTSTCSGAYAAYRVSFSYTGPTMTVRRSSDSVPSDFYANAYGQLGTAINGTGTSLESWLGTATGFVTKWHDQSGKGNHATQTTAASQPRIDYVNNRLDFTTNSGTAFLSIPNGTVPTCTTYSVSGYISTNSAARTTLATINITIQNIYEAALTATVQMSGAHVGSNVGAAYLPGSRSDINSSNEFSVIYCFFDSGYTKAARVVFRQTGSIIDCYQSQGLNWNFNATGTYNSASITDANVPGGPSCYGVSYISILFKPSYTVSVKHNTILNGNGTWVGASGAAGSGTNVNLSNAFRRNAAGYMNYWYSNDFLGNDTYQVGNIVTYTYDGTYSNLYINGTPQGVSGIRAGWAAQPGNEFIGKSPYNEYLNGELYSLFIFKSLLSVNDRTHIEKSMPSPNITGPIKFSQLRTACGLPTAVSFSQLQKYAGIPSSSATSISAYNGFVLRNGLFMRFYSNTYFSNNVNFFNSNTPTITGVVTNLRNTYCATGGISNSSPGYENQIGNIAVMSTFSFELFGLFYAPVTGTYTFYLLSDDTGLIWIGDNALSGYTTGNALFYTQGVYTEVTRTTTTELTAGTYYPFRFQYGAGGFDTLKFSFMPPGGTRVYDGTGYFFCQTINNPNNNSLSVYFPFELTDVNQPSIIKARYVGFEFGNTTGGNRYINVLGVSVFSSYNGSNIINTGMTVTASSFGTATTPLIDNDNATLFYTSGNELNPWVMIDLGSEQYIHKVQLHNRVDCCSERISGARLFLRDGSGSTFYNSNLIANKAGSTIYDGGNNGYFYYTWWPSVNTIPYGSDSVPIYNGTNGYSLYTLYNGASLSSTVYKLGSSSLSLTASSSQYAQISNFTSTTNGLTFAFWYKSNGSGVWSRIFDFGNGSANENIFVTANSGGNNLQCGYYYGSSGTSYSSTLSDINYNDNVWRHVVWTLTYATTGSATSTWNVYVNSVNKSSVSTNAYPTTSVTRVNSYIGRSGWAADAYYNGNIDEFRIYDTVLSATDVTALYNNTSTNYTYRMLNGSTVLTTTIQGTTPTNPATSGYAIYSANPWLPDGYYWIKSAAMPNALQMYVDIKNGGYDFYQITGGTSVNYITQTHSGIALGLELAIPRSQDSWIAIYKYVKNILGSDYPTWFSAWPIYNTSVGNYGGYAMFDPRFGNSGSNASSYTGAPDWRCKDGGLWYIRDIPFGEPSGDYIANAFIGPYSEVTYPQWLTSYGSCGFNDANANYSTGTNYIVSTNYAGCTTSTLYEYFDGTTSARAAPSALYIKNRTGTNSNAVYWINLPGVGPTQIFCIMDSAVDGGGWMMAMKATRGTTFNYDSSHWTTATTLNPTDTTRNDADAKFHSMNYFQCKDMLALWPDIGAGGSLTLSGYNNWCWMKNNFNGGARQPLINYFAVANNVSFGVAKGVERGTVFSSQPGNSFYGLNFTSNYTYRVRWGLAWNNEYDWGSNDVGGGIGMSAASYSAGDYIGCCQDQIGINRSARVEMYVR